MMISVMQPYFFPYIGYFSLIRHTDLFISCDEVQYIKLGWINRNRIISLEKEFAYIHANIQKCHQCEVIKNIRISTDPCWKNLLLSQLRLYKNKASFYGPVIGLVKECMAYEELSLGKWNTHSLKMICQYLDISHDIRLLSEMTIKYEAATSSDEWGLNLSVAYGAEIYRNLPGGMSFYQKNKYQARGVELQFITNNLTPYPQGVQEFVPALSILDVLMFNSPRDVRLLIEDCTIS